jgi:uncharacterized membrane-anchored protein
MRKSVVRAALAALALLVAAPAYADGPGNAGPDVAAPPVNARPQPTEPVRAAPVAPPQGRSGVVPLSGGVSLNVSRNYRFYGPQEANAFLQRNGAAGPSGEVLGLIAPANADIRAPGTWATIVSYDAIGYVQGETAAGLSDPSFEDQVREARRGQNRPFEGFAAQPAFGATTTPRVIWAERAAAPGSGGADLRYEQKYLGRYGVAGLTSIGSADQMSAMEAAAQTLEAMLSFPDGRAYGDFLPASDTVSTFTVPALVTGVDPASAVVAEPAADAASGAGQTSFGGLAGWFPWIALGVVVLAGVGYFLMRPRRDDNDDNPEEPNSPEQDHTAA